MENLEGLFEQAPDLIVTYGMKVLLAIVIFVVGKYLAGLAKKITCKLLLKKKIDETVASFVGNMAWGLVLVFTIVATLGQVGIQTASLVAVIGAAGLAVGLALQGSLSNFASGVLMVLFRPCRVGDYVEAAGIAGTVSEITIFSTKLLTPDNKLIIAPNSAMMDGTIINYSAMDTRRVDLVIGVSYDANLADTKNILTKIVENNQYVLKDPVYTIAVSELADSSVNFVVRPWVKGSDYWPAYFELLEQIKIALDEANIGIPYPQMDLHVKEAPAV
ncbi:mechanosensitive ion channel [Shewanella sp. D64]|uniref:mechanosensitive ion channel family protein n=1 Tax=unclassified Shewanella TaxID=196818 RepID=UPI0022BA1ECC|nr:MULTISPECIES: mechanosensitive ion channel domain-containing protein [unclassified Shewanella]MEC4728250.1 mechanosensitive ion channel [Shewanella sp. D64]MEC4739296.1 mechanosensitive ion channel [Shewanella sp. E94]WBJ97044.1 mechanosensitive ion channel [Shewanella sp. MTB7]